MFQTTPKQLPNIKNNSLRYLTKKKISGLSLSKAFDDLHWLRVKTRVVYKIMLIVHNCLKGQAPNELMALLQYGDSSRTLHLQMTRVKTKYGDRAFSHMAPKLWNRLPLHDRRVENTEKL